MVNLDEMAVFLEGKGKKHQKQLKSQTFGSVNNCNIQRINKTAEILLSKQLKNPQMFAFDCLISDRIVKLSN